LRLQRQDLFERLLSPGTTNRQGARRQMLKAQQHETAFDANAGTPVAELPWPTVPPHYCLHTCAFCFASQTVAAAIARKEPLLRREHLFA
jgi:hypothetical protein